MSGLIQNSFGLMQNQPLLLSSLLRHAETFHANAEIVSRVVDGSIHRYTYREAAIGARRLADAMRRFGIERGDRVATLAWNNYRHFEIQYATTGSGVIWHPINPRLHVDQVSYIANHAQDRILFFDQSFLSLVEQVSPQLATAELYVFLGHAHELPKGSNLQSLISYEEFLASGDEHYEWPTFDELSASSLFYTSGTTGNPKGVLYSHRSDVLHALAVCSADSAAYATRDVILPMTPMFHANAAWGTSHAAPMTGAKLVLCGPQLDPRSIGELVYAEGVTVMAGVPTLYTKLVDYFKSDSRGAGQLERIVVAGSAPAPSLIESLESLGVDVLHVWGMTETSPTGTSPRPGQPTGDATKKVPLKTSQGRPTFGVEIRIADERGNPLPNDGRTPGRLMVRGPWVIKSYYKTSGECVDQHGWFDTGDLATLDENWYLRITDRSKDVIKSGGEWISSIEIENLVMACPGVADAAVVGLPHPVWGERPLLIIVPSKQAPAEAEMIRSFLQFKIAKWWMPDDIVFVDALSYGATGKVQKMELRNRFARHYQLGSQP